MNRRYTHEISDQVWPRVSFALVIFGALLAFAVALPIAGILVFAFSWLVDWNEQWTSCSIWLAGFTWLFSYGTCYACMSSAIKQGLSSASQYSRMIRRTVTQVTTAVAGILTVYLVTWQVFDVRGWARESESPEFMAALASVGVLVVYAVIWSKTTEAFENFVASPNPQPRTISTPHLNRALEHRQKTSRRRSKPTRSSCPIDSN